MALTHKFHFHTKLLTLVLVGLIVGCKPTTKDVEGVYKRSDQTITEVLTLKHDGKFQLTVKYADGRSWLIEDSWSLIERVIRLDKCYLTYDFEKEKIIDPPKLVYMATFLWEDGRLYENELYKHPFIK